MTEAPARGVRLSCSARRAQLLVAARDVFAAQGYHAAAMDDIAERAGVSKPVLYQHFPGKPGALPGAAHDLRGRPGGAGPRRDRRHVGQPGAGRGGGVGVLRLVAGDGQAYRLVFESDVRGEPEAAAVVDGALTRCIGYGGCGRHHGRRARRSAGPAARGGPGAEPGGRPVLAGLRAGGAGATRPWR